MGARLIGRPALRKKPPSRDRCTPDRPCFRRHPIFLRRYVDSAEELTAAGCDPAIKRSNSNKLAAAINPPDHRESIRRDFSPKRGVLTDRFPPGKRTGLPGSMGWLQRIHGDFVRVATIGRLD